MSKACGRFLLSWATMCLTLLFKIDHALSTASCAAPQAVLELCSGLRSGLYAGRKTILVWYWTAKSSITFPLCIDALSRISKYFLVCISWCCKPCNKHSNQHTKILRSHEPWNTKGWINLNGAVDLTALIMLSLVPCPPDLNTWQRFPFGDQPYSAIGLLPVS